jgi:single-stranded DNA-specific DHH superfamily exonuclease
MMDERIKFVRSLKGNVAIFFDQDCDGTCSAAIFYAYCRQLGVKAKAYVGNIDEKSFKRFAKKKFNAAVILDFGVSQYPEYLKDFRGKRVMIVDHHKVVEDLNNIGFLFINPRLEDPNTYVSTTHISFDICKEAELKGLEWVARVGMVGDYEVEGTKTEREATDIIAAVSILRRNDLEKLVEFLSKTKRIEDFVYNTKYQKMRIKLNKEVEKQIKAFEREDFGDIAFFQLKSKYGITSIVATNLFDKYPYKTIVVYTKRGNFYKFSARSKKIDLAECFRRITQGIGKGGGHPVAAGGMIQAKYLKEFKKRFIETCETEL